MIYYAADAVATEMPSMVADAFITNSQIMLMRWRGKNAVASLDSPHTLHGEAADVCVIITGMPIARVIAANLMSAHVTGRRCLAALSRRISALKIRCHGHARPTIHWSVDRHSRRHDFCRAHDAALASTPSWSAQLYLQPPRRHAQCNVPFGPAA